VQPPAPVARGRCGGRGARHGCRSRSGACVVRRRVLGVGSAGGATRWRKEAVAWRWMFRRRCARRVAAAAPRRRRGGRGGGQNARSRRCRLSDAPKVRRAPCRDDKKWPAAAVPTCRNFVNHIDYLREEIGSTMWHFVGLRRRRWCSRDGKRPETFNVTLELVRRGYTEAQIEKICERQSVEGVGRGREGREADSGPVSPSSLQH